MQLAFVLAVLGFGTKMGLVPVHTWLPDAHSEAPTPVSALLSGSLLAISFYAILRFYQVAEAALGSQFPRNVLLVFGVASLLLAALYLFGQRDIKRLLAYSSVEHMGILAIGVSFGAPAALAGVLLHVLAHAAAKGNAFMGAGVLVRKFGTKRIVRHPRRAGPAAVERSAVPAGGLRAGRDAAVRPVPQRVRDRGRRPGVGKPRRRRDPDHRSHGRVLRPGGVHDHPAAPARAPRSAAGGRTASGFRARVRACARARANGRGHGCRRNRCSGARPGPAAWPAASRAPGW